MDAVSMENEYLHNFNFPLVKIPINTLAMLIQGFFLGVSCVQVK